MGLRAKIYRWLLSGYQRESGVCEPRNEPRGSHVKRLPSRTRLMTMAEELGEMTLDTQGIYFKVIPGSGGVAIEVSHYDSKTERDITTLHIIPEGEELSEALAKIITLEAMRR